MTDPVYQKLKADAEVILIEMWRAFRHQAPALEWQNLRESSESENTVPAQTADPGAVRSQAGSLCYFHLN